MKRLVLASGNPGKLREIRALLAPLALEVIDRREQKLHSARNGWFARWLSGRHLVIPAAALQTGEKHMYLSMCGAASAPRCKAIRRSWPAGS